jgi:HSP20 family protein
MSPLVVKVTDASERLPIFEEIAKRLEAVRQRAFDLFEKRGRELGHDREDWLKAEHELFSPVAELAENDDAYQMQISLPGFESKDVEITAAPNEVIVHAATKGEKKTQQDNVLWTEFGSSDVYRRFEVPIAVIVDQVTAKLDNGILRINAPKATNAKEPKAAAA